MSNDFWETESWEQSKQRYCYNARAVRVNQSVIENLTCVLVLKRKAKMQQFHHLQQAEESNN